MSVKPNWEKLIGIYSPDSDVYIAIAEEADRSGQPGSGYDLFEYLSETQGIGPGPSVWYGDPGNLQHYVWGESVQTLVDFVEQHVRPGPTPTPTPPTPTPSPPSPPSGDYLVADQSYVCPAGYSAVQSTEGCKAAAAAVDGLPSSVTAQSDPGDPPFCWAYGNAGAYTNLYMNSAGSTSGARPLRSSVCQRDAPTPTPAPPSVKYVVADQSYLCPVGYEAITTSEECLAAAVSAAGMQDWMDVTDEQDKLDPVGCFVYGTQGSYSYIYLNKWGMTEKTREQRSIVCREMSTLV